MTMISPFTPSGPGSGSRRTDTARRFRATTLLEILVVIVIFLVGILAIAQIFPRGFQILLTTRNNSIASALGRDEIERIKSNQSTLAEMILPVTRVGNALVVDPTYNPTHLDAEGDQLMPTGELRKGGNILGPWQQYSAANVVRRVVGEGGRVPAPREVGSSTLYYGGPMVLQFGPIDYQPASGAIPSNLTVYGNDLQEHLRDVQDGEQWGDGEYYVASADTSDITLRLPAGPQERRYRVSFSAYVKVGGTYVKRDYIDLPAIDVPVAAGPPYPLYSQMLSAMIAPDVLTHVDTATLRVQRQYFDVGVAGSFSNDPYEFKLIDNALGVLLFNPIASSVYFDRPDRREPLEAKVNYDVYDWRVLREDFRLAPTGGTQQYKLAVGSLKVFGETDADGRQTSRISSLEDAPADATFTDDSAADEARANNMVIVDLDTGGLIMERLSSDQAPPNPAASPLIQVDKHTGVITFHDSDGDSSNGTTGKLLLPDKTIKDVQLENRALRVLYRTKNEFAVQVLKAAASYAVTGPPVGNQLGAAQFYVGGAKPWSAAEPGIGTRIYFPIMDVGRKVTVDEIDYFAGASSRQIFGQDFVIQFNPGDTLPLPSIDLRDIDSSATAFDFTSGAAAKHVKGASVAVRVLWNPDHFTLSSDSAVNGENIRRLQKWGQSWRHTTDETILQGQEAAR